MKKFLIQKKAWIFLFTIIILIIGVIVFIKINDKPKKLNNIHIEMEKSSEEKISDDFKSGKINEEEYVLYNVYLVFDYGKLDDKYKSENNIYSPQLNDIITLYYDKLSDATKEYISEKMSFNNIILGPDLTSKTSYNETKIKSVSKNLADSGDVKTRLEKHVISKNKRIVVWYTTVDEENKITDEQAKNLADKMEEFTYQYENIYGINYKYEKAYFEGSDESSYRTFLNSVDSENADDLFNMMPVYVSNFSNSESYAAYFGGVQNSIYKKSDDNYLQGLSVVPFIVVKPAYINYDKTFAHEMFHHFQKYICGNGEYKICEKNQSGEENFIIETSANWASFNIVNDMNEFNTLNLLYLNSAETSIDEINSYTTMSFLKNYEAIVDNGTTKILNAFDGANTNYDTLRYLYNESNGKMPLVMQSMAKNNLVNEYDDVYKGYQDNNLNYIIKHILEVENGSVNEMAIKYYGTIDNSGKYKISNLNLNDGAYITIFNVGHGHVITDSSSIQSYEDISVLYSGKMDKDIIIDLEKYKGDSLVFAISNGNLDQKVEYSITATNEEQNIDFFEDLNLDKNDDNNKISAGPIIKYNDEIMDIESFLYNNGRTYVNLYDFCSISNICSVSNSESDKNVYYIDKNIEVTGDKITSDISGNTQYIYRVTHTKGEMIFYPDIMIANRTIQDNATNQTADVPSCPSDIEEYKCDNEHFYVPVRFLSQSLGLRVEWDGENNTVNIKNNFVETFLSKYDVVTTTTKDCNNSSCIVEKNGIYTDVTKGNTYYLNVINKDTNENMDYYKGYSFYDSIKNIGSENNPTFKSGVFTINGSRITVDEPTQNDKVVTKNIAQVIVYEIKTTDQGYQESDYNAGGYPIVINNVFRCNDC